MDQFARIVVGLHGCTEEFGRELLLGTRPVPSTNDWDWLGHGIYFWEHSPERAMRWAQETFTPRGEPPAVIGAVIQLGRCFDLLNEAMTALLVESYLGLEQAYKDAGLPLPQNRGRDWQRRELDCLVLNTCLTQLKDRGTEYDTVRAAFLEGDPVYPKAGFSREAHIQMGKRDSCG
jgi:hypothetical protein